jgi:tetratricopeptide (TPR) repeat protein
MTTIVALALATALAGDQSAREVINIVKDWVRAVREHQPGVIDQPLLQISQESAQSLDLVRQHLYEIVQVYADRPESVKVDVDKPEARNDIIRRGAVLHMDIALLLPRQAAKFTLDDLPAHMDPYSGRMVRNQEEKLVFSTDGEYIALRADTAHWWFASALLNQLLPHPSRDPFVPAWYRAVAAYFEGNNLFGSARYHLRRGLSTLPRDPVLLFYSGTMHEAAASASIQNVQTTRPAMSRELKMQPPETEWRAAERDFRTSVEEHGPIEARVRLGRVLGLLGKHAEAASILRTVQPELREPRLQYLCALFLGSEEAALRRVDAAREAFERAASLYPTAQSPLLGLSEMHRRANRQAAALEALRRLERLPRDPKARDDPWTTYQRSFAPDPDRGIASIRGWFDRKADR